MCWGLDPRLALGLGPELEMEVVLEVVLGRGWRWE